MSVSIDLIKKLRDITLAPLGDCKDALVESNGDLVAAQEILRKNGAIKADKKSDRETNAWIVKFSVTDAGLVGVKLLCETDFVAKNDAFSTLVDLLLTDIAAYAGDIDPDAIPESLMATLTTHLQDHAVTIGENMKIGYVIKKSGNVYAYNHMGNTIASAVFYDGVLGDNAQQAAKDAALQVAAMNPYYISMDTVPADRTATLRAEFEAEMTTSGKPADIIAKIVDGKISKALQDDVLLEQASIKDQSKKVKETLPTGMSILSMVRVSV